MRRSVLARSVRKVIETLEARVLLAGNPVVPNAIPAPLPAVGSISGTVFYDLNLNGAQDFNESPIPGASVFVDLNGNGIPDAGEPTTTTDASGMYTFTALTAGNYQVRVIPPAGFHQDAPGVSIVNLQAGGPATVDIGVNSTIQITGTVFNDVNQDDKYDYPREDFLAGDTVYLDLNNNAQYDAPITDPISGNVITPGEPSATSNNLGVYTLNVPGPGTYKLRVIPRPGFHQDPPGYLTITVSNGQLLTQDIGENNRTTLAGTLFMDLNGNGVQDAGDTPVAGETVYLDLNHNGFFDPPQIDPMTYQQTNGDFFSTTDANGQYIFTGLTPGVYRLMVQSAQGLLMNNPGYIDVTITTGADTIVNIGEGAPVNIGGTFYNDVNGNGVMNSGETGVGLANQIVFLDQNNNGVADPPSMDQYGNLIPEEPRASTDAAGNYLYSNIAPGTYVVRAQIPMGAIETGPVNPSRGYTITVGSGGSVTGENFGFKTGDLTATILNLPTTPTLTAKLRPAVVRVTNVGSLPVNGLVGVTLYAAATPNVVPGDTLTSTIGIHPGIYVNLKPGQSKIYRFKYSFPVQLPQNKYYVVAQVNGPQDNNPLNDLSAPVGPIEVGPPYVDLNVTYLIPPPLIVDSGKRLELIIDVANLGNVVNRNDLTFNVFSSSTQALEPNAQPILTYVVRHPKIWPNTAKTFGFLLPYSTQDLGYRYILTYVDAGNILGEYDSVNNLAIPQNPTFFR